MRNRGHIRRLGVCVRHSPQRLQSSTASLTRAGSQSSCSSTRLRKPAGSSAAVTSGTAAPGCAVFSAPPPATPLAATVLLPTGAAPCSAGRKYRVIQIRVVADDLARIEDVLRVEDPLHFAKTSNSGPACRRTNAVRLSPQACSLLMVPRTAKNFLIQFFGHRRIRSTSSGWPDRGRAERGAGRGRRGRTPRRHLIALQYVLHPHQEIGQHIGRDGHVFDDRHGTARALYPV